MSQCRSQYVTEYLGSVCINHKHELWIVMEYMMGSVRDVIDANRSFFRLNERGAMAMVLHDILMALAYLHSHGHIHRDVKVCM